MTARSAAHQLTYSRRALATGRYASRGHRKQLVEIAQHREQFLLQAECCFSCGRRIKNAESLTAWRDNGHLGPECVKKR